MDKDKTTVVREDANQKTEKSSGWAVELRPQGQVHKVVELPNGKLCKLVSGRLVPLDE